jgi:hypothetical protein
MCLYNEERPHEALGQTPLAQHYQPSPRDYQGRLVEIEYRRIGKCAASGVRFYALARPCHFPDSRAGRTAVALEPMTVGRPTSAFMLAGCWLNSTPTVYHVLGTICLLCPGIDITS